MRNDFLLLQQPLQNENDDGDHQKGIDFSVHYLVQFGQVHAGNFN